ncbi:hypothetical protein E4U41_007662 [Claviceps citrina]|nr:hypothetical protein E4U41_007662 [Claviceps citrina]
MGGAQELRGGLRRREEGARGGRHHGDGDGDGDGPGGAAWEEEEQEGDEVETVETVETAAVQEATCG